MNSLVVREIKHSVDLMDKFEDGDYDYLELKHWFWVRDYKDREWVSNDNTGFYYVTLLVSKIRDKDKKLCVYSPSMTELRQMKHHGIALDEDYPEGSMDEIISSACRVWETDVTIELPVQICLRAQTSWNRINYGCEWLGGGEWEEKTLYGETTDYFITGIILRERNKSEEQERREILTELRNRMDENFEFIDKVMAEFKHVNQPVTHKNYGNGIIVEIIENKMRVQFVGKEASFICPDSILQGYFSIPEHNEIIEDAIVKWDENIQLGKWVKRFEYAQDDFLATYKVLRDYKTGDMLC